MSEWRQSPTRETNQSALSADIWTPGGVGKSGVQIATSMFYSLSPGAHYSSIVSPSQLWERWLLGGRAGGWVGGRVGGSAGGWLEGREGGLRWVCERLGGWMDGWLIGVHRIIWYEGCQPNPTWRGAFCQNQIAFRSRLYFHIHLYETFLWIERVVSGSQLRDGWLLGGWKGGIESGFVDGWDYRGLMKYMGLKESRHCHHLLKSGVGRKQAVSLKVIAFVRSPWKALTSC